MQRRTVASFFHEFFFFFFFFLFFFPFFCGALRVVEADRILLERLNVVTVHCIAVWCVGCDAFAFIYLLLEMRGRWCLAVKKTLSRVSSVASFERFNCIICRIGPGLLDRRVLIRGFKAGFYGILFMNGTRASVERRVLASVTNF